MGEWIDGSAGGFMCGWMVFIFILPVSFNTYLAKGAF